MHSPLQRKIQYMKDNIRDAMERLDKAFPNRETLTLKETAAFLGLTQERTKEVVRRNKAKRYSKITIAHFLCD